MDIVHTLYMVSLIQKLSKARVGRRQKRSHVVIIGANYGHLCFQGKWTELSQMCHHLLSDLAWHKFRQRAIVPLTVRSNPKVCQTQSSHLQRAPPWQPFQTYPVLCICCHLFTSNGIANRSNAVFGSWPKSHQCSCTTSQTLSSLRTQATFH